MSGIISKQIKNRNLLFYFDAANIKSYIGSGNIGYELSTGSAVPGSEITLLPGVTWSSSNCGVMSFNGTYSPQEIAYNVDSWITCGDRISKLGLTFPITLEAWINPKKLNGSTAGPVYGIFALDSPEQYPGNYYGVDIQLSANDGTDTHSFSGGYYDGTGSGPDSRKNATTSNRPVICGKWNHVVAVVIGINNILLYVNGYLMTTSLSGTGTSLAWSGGLGKTVIGKYTGYYKYLFNGDIAMVRAYNSILSVSDIKDNYNLHSLRFGLENI
jgi:hypothetical protein